MFVYYSIIIRAKCFSSKIDFKKFKLVLEFWHRVLETRFVAEVELNYWSVKTYFYKCVQHNKHQTKDLEPNTTISKQFMVLFLIQSRFKHGPLHIVNYIHRLLIISYIKDLGDSCVP